RAARTLASVRVPLGKDAPALSRSCRDRPDLEGNGHVVADAIISGAALSGSASSNEAPTLEGPSTRVPPLRLGDGPRNRQTETKPARLSRPVGTSQGEERFEDLRVHLDDVGEGFVILLAHRLDDSSAGDDFSRVF